MRPLDKGMVYLFSVSSGYRGHARAEVIEGGEVVTSWAEFHNVQLGATGETRRLLINAGTKPVLVRWHKSIKLDAECP